MKGYEEAALNMKAEKIILCLMDLYFVFANGIRKYGLGKEKELKFVENILLLLRCIMRNSVSFTEIICNCRQKEIAGPTM